MHNKKKQSDAVLEKYLSSIQNTDKTYYTQKWLTIDIETRNDVLYEWYWSYLDWCELAFNTAKETCFCGWLIDGL